MTLRLVWDGGKRSATVHRDGVLIGRLHRTWLDPPHGWHVFSPEIETGRFDLADEAAFASLREAVAWLVARAEQEG